MILVKEMPTSGQFVAVWEYGDVLYSNSYMWEDDYLVEYNEEQDQWLSLCSDGHLKAATFIVK